MSNNQPLDFSSLACLLDAQPEPVRSMFQYCLALAMVELGKGRLIATVPGEVGPICIFEASGGEWFSLARPPISETQETRVIEELRRILGNTCR